MPQPHQYPEASDPYEYNPSPSTHAIALIPTDFTNSVAMATQQPAPKRIIQRPAAQAPAGVRKTKVTTQKTTTPERVKQLLRQANEAEKENKGQLYADIFEEMEYEEVEEP